MPYGCLLFIILIFIICSSALGLSISILWVIPPVAITALIIMLIIEDEIDRKKRK